MSGNPSYIEIRAGLLGQIALLIGLFFTSFYTFSQSILDKRFDLSPTNSWDEGGGLIFYQDTIYIAGGTYMSSGLWGTTFFKCTSNGTPIDTTYLEKTGNQIFSTKLDRIGDSLIVAGSEDGDSYGWDPFIAIYNLNLDSLYYKKFDTTKHIVINTFSQTLDGGYLLYGTILDSIGGTDWADIYLLRLDQNFNKVWDKRINQTYYAFAHSINQLGNDFLLSGHKWNPTIWHTDELFLYRIDSLGNTLNIKVHPQDHEITGGHACIYDDRIYMISVVSDSAPVSHSFHYRRPQLIVLDTAFNIINTTKFGTHGAVNYSWLPHGVFVQNERVYTYGHEHPKAFVACFDLDGNYLWKLTYSDTTYASRQDISNLISVSPNNFMGIGAKENFTLGVNDRDHWLFRIDSLGCIESGCNPYLGSGDFNRPYIKLFPNPFSETIQIQAPFEESTKIYIYTLLGEVVYESKIAGEQSINLSYLDKGQYILRMVYQDFQFSQKIIKQ